VVSTSAAPSDWLPDNKNQGNNEDCGVRATASRFVQHKDEHLFRLIVQTLVGAALVVGEVRF
jgi:hypothetical protein